MQCQELLKSASCDRRKLTHAAAGLYGRVVRGRKNPLWTGLPERLRRIRDEAGLALHDVAKLAGCSHAAIFSIEAEGVSPKVDTVEKIAHALNVSPCWLAFGNEGPLVFRKKRPRSSAPASEPPPADSDQNAALLLGSRLREARETNGLSARALALKAGLSVQQVLNTETGATLPKVENVERLAVALGVPPCWLAYGDGVEA